MPNISLIQSFYVNLEQLPLWVVPALGTAGAGGQTGLPKPTTTGANFWGPGGCWFRRPVPPGLAPGGLNHGGFRAPVWGKWMFGHHHPSGCPKRYKNDYPPGGVAELSSAIFTFGMDPCQLPLWLLPARCAHLEQ